MASSNPGEDPSLEAPAIPGRRRWLPVLDRSEQAVIYNQMRNNARAGVDFYVMILLSSSIAYFGLLQNSVAVIIGAMLVAPLMSPMIAIAHSIVMGNLLMFRRAALSTLSGILLAIASAAIMTAALPNLDLIPPTDEILGRTQPNMLDQYIALVSGAAAAYALSRKQVAAALPGVAIAAALVPPLCVVGYGLGSQQMPIAWGALLLFLTNLASIVFASAAVFMLLGFRPTRVERTENVRRGVVVAVVGLLLVTVPLGFATMNSVRELATRITVNNTLADLVSADIADVRDVRVRFDGEQSNIEFTAYPFLDSGKTASNPESRARMMQYLRELLEDELAEPFTIQALVVDSYLNEAESADESDDEKTRAE